jgi:two-component sensor histidine kinase
VALRPFMDDQERRFEIVGPAFRLGSRVALALAMALHELATNAVKYGALSNETGHVLLNWTMVDGSPPSRLRLRWQETGGPPVHPPTRTGFGSRMIERALATEIGGPAEIDYRPDGVVFTAEAPLPKALGH